MPPSPGRFFTVYDDFGCARPRLSAMSRAPTVVPNHSWYFSTDESPSVQANVSVAPLSVAPGVGSTIFGPQSLHAVYW